MPDGGLVVMVPVPQPPNNHQRHSGQVQQPCDDDERQGRAVSRSQGVARESGMGDGKADDDEKEGEGREEDGEELESVRVVVRWARECVRGRSR